MKSLWVLALLIFLFPVNILAQELTQKDVERVLQDSKNGNPIAQAYLGDMHYHGNGMPLNHIEAAKWWRKAAEQDNAFGQVNLGRMLSRGEKVPLNHAEALKWYRKAAEQGNSNGQLALASAYHYGKGTVGNRIAALKWYKEAANQGNSQALLELGNIHQYGRIGMTKSGKEAMKWYLKAAEKGNSNGYYEIGGMYSIYGGRFTRDYAEAIKWYRKAAELGNSEGQEKLGSMYRDGEGVNKDLKEAKKWFSKAAEQGNLHAKRALYEMSDKGKREIAFNELSQMIKNLFLMLLFFPVWWFIAGHVFNCPSRHLNIITIVTFAGGIVGFLITFACNGGVGGSAEISSTAWGCLLSYMAIHNMVLALIFFSGQRKRIS
jgi:TPR repeat protein